MQARYPALMTDVQTTVRLPLATIPAAVLPGSVVTLMLASDGLRSAVAAARATADGAHAPQTPGTGDLAVVAQVPDVGALPSGDPAAVVSVDQRARVVRRPPRRERRRLRRRRTAAPTPVRHRASRRSAARCAAC